MPVADSLAYARAKVLKTLWTISQQQIVDILDPRRDGCPWTLHLVPVGEYEVGKPASHKFMLLEGRCLVRSRYQKRVWTVYLLSLYDAHERLERFGRRFYNAASQFRTLFLTVIASAHLQYLFHQKQARTVRASLLRALRHVEITSGKHWCGRINRITYIFVSVSNVP